MADDEGQWLIPDVGDAKDNVDASTPLQIDPDQRKKIEENYQRAKRIRLAKLAATHPRSEPQSSSGASTPTSSPEPQISRQCPGGFFPASPMSSERLGTRSGHPHSPLQREEPPILYPLERNDRCSHCSSIELDAYMKDSFGVFVCSSCREAFPELYSLIVKTTAMQEYLLTNEELQDSAIFPFVRKPNPHKSSWSEMQLFLLKHVRQFATEKWGSMELLQEELTRRSREKEARKERKYNRLLSGKPRSCDVPLSIQFF